MVRSFPVSTASNGIGCEVGSNRTHSENFALQKRLVTAAQSELYLGVELPRARCDLDALKIPYAHPKRISFLLVFFGLKVVNHIMQIPLGVLFTFTAPIKNICWENRPHMAAFALATTIYWKFSN